MDQKEDIKIKSKEQMQVYRITDLAINDRPRERLAEVGPQALSNAELIAILLRVGVQGENAVQLGQRLLNHFGGLAGLHKASFIEVCQQHGLGAAKAAQVKAAIELGRRMTLESPEERPAIHSPGDAAALVNYEMSALTQEQLWVLLTDTRNRLIGIEKVYKGSLNASSVRVGELFKAAIQRNAASILIVHNHPSGATRSM
jgi:DNA repair protein RadC